jgi:hypothetical protein
MKNSNYNIMKKRLSLLAKCFILIMVVSCDEPETVVTNFVHPDGSVTRKIEMRNTKNNFAAAVLQVPFDNTWSIKDTISIGEKGDTTWIKTGEKFFKNVDEINLAYDTDSGANKGIPRHAGFKKTFRWFNTGYRFSEKIDRQIAYGYPVKDFLNEEEFLFFYSPESIKSEKENGTDSLVYRALRDSLNKKTDKWTYKNFVAMWIEEFSKLTDGKAGNDMKIGMLKEREDEFVNLIIADEAKFDSLWSNGTILKEFIGESNALKFKTEADTAISIVTRNFLFDFKDYSVRIEMPGKVTMTNGFIDGSGFLLWPVKSDYFLTENYEMYAESKVPNTWAWIVSGLFLVFVFSGVIFRIIKRG